MKGKFIEQMLILIGLIFLLTNLVGQNSDCYENLDFKSFLAEKVENDTFLIRELYKSIRYPVELKKYRVEGVVEVIVINHNERNMEIIQLNLNDTFSDVVDKISLAMKQSSVDRKQPFITRFFINFDLDPFRFKDEEYKKYHLGLLNDNTITIRDLIVPDVYKY